jgi:prepilin-type N-terminal cleavage/methylation domain-containing protein
MNTQKLEFNKKSWNVQYPILNVHRSFGFTLLELMLAITILSLVTTVTYMTFSTVIKAWSRGAQLTEELHHGDFVVEQIMLGLRSAYYPESDQKDSKYGFWQVDNGDGEGASDEISWVALGSALIGKENVYFGSPHRVRVTIEDNEDGDPAVAVRSWRVKGQDEDFEPEDIDPVFLSTEIQGMNCRTAYEMDGDELDWLDEWEETNKIPKYVELTLYMKPLERGDDPVEVKRLVKISAGDLCWGKEMEETSGGKQ